VSTGQPTVQKKELAPVKDKSKYRSNFKDMLKGKNNFIIAQALKKDQDEKYIKGGYVYEISFPDDSQRKEAVKVNDFNVGCIELRQDENKVWQVTIRDFQLEMELTLNFSEIF
jgi:hypothetical protein